MGRLGAAGLRDRGTGAGIDPADVPYTGPAGIPGTPATPLVAVPGPIDIWNEVAYEQTATPTNANLPGLYAASSVIPGDLIVLADPNGGDAPSNWLAVAQFFNPSDPTGAQGLLSTEQEGCFARDFGSQGFADFPLMPNVGYATLSSATSDGDAMQAVGRVIQFGPVGAIRSGQEEIMLLTVTTLAVPEPGTIGIVALGGMILIAARLRRRYEESSHV